MSSPITPITHVPPSGGMQLPQQNGTDGQFREMLEGAIGQVEASRNHATATVERFLSGDGEDLHTAVLATQRAELTFEMFLQVRNKVVQAYQEIMRMQM